MSMMAPLAAVLSSSPRFRQPGCVHTDPFASDLFGPLALPSLDVDFSQLSDLLPTQDLFVSNLPKVEMQNLPDHVQVKLTLPEQWDPKGLSVEVQDQTLKIKAKNRHEGETRQEGYYRKDFSQRSFTRELRLPAEVDAKQTQARLEGKTLLITVPKMLPQAPATAQPIPVTISSPSPFGQSSANPFS